MIKGFLSLMWILHSVQEGLSQYFMCPYENGLYYATSPDCLVYYRCQNRKLWSGVCFPWQRFDVHSVSCRSVENVDCNPEYAGIWRPIYGDESNVINQEVQETDQEVADEAIQGATEDETDMIGNEGEEAQVESNDSEDEQEEVQEAPEEEIVMSGNEDGEEVQNKPIDNGAEQQEIEEASDESIVANEGEDIQEELAGENDGNEAEEVDNLETAQAELEDTENKELQGEEGEQKEDEAELNGESQEGILQEKDSKEEDNESRGNEEDIIKENGQNDNLQENNITTQNEKGIKGEILDNNENNSQSSVKAENKEMQNEKPIKEEDSTTDKQKKQENEEDNILGKTEAQFDDENDRAVNSMALDGKFLPKLFKNIPIGRESVIPDLIMPIVTSVLIQESTTESNSVSDQETNCQLSSTDADLKPFVESTTSVETKQEDSAGRFWYWCGSGRFVMTQTPQDPNTICQQLEDPQFIDQEGPGTGTQDWGGHTFLGSDTSISKRHTL